MVLSRNVLFCYNWSLSYWYVHVEQLMNCLVIKALSTQMILIMFGVDTSFNLTLKDANFLQVWCVEPEEQQYQNWTVDSSQLSLHISSLKQGKQYWVTIAAVNGAGVGMLSDPHGFVISEQYSCQLFISVSGQIKTSMCSQTGLYSFIMCFHSAAQTHS